MTLYIVTFRQNKLSKSDIMTEKKAQLSPSMKAKLALRSLSRTPLKEQNILF